MILEKKYEHIGMLFKERLRRLLALSLFVAGEPLFLQIVLFLNAFFETRISDARQVGVALTFSQVPPGTQLFCVAQL